MNRAIKTTMGSGEWAMLLILSVLWGGSFFFVEVDREKIAGVVRNERVDPDRLLAGKVAVDDRIRYAYQRTIAAIGAFDPWLLADTGTPLVGARRGIARLTSGRTFPAHRMHICASPE